MFGLVVFRREFLLYGTTANLVYMSKKEVYFRIKLKIDIGAKKRV
ncbi:MAG: hypothetical protein QXR19_15030 [Candidatus Jordarchaeaceae archaeon]